MAIRSYGLSGSGLDVDQLVKDAMKAQQARYDKVVQQKTQVEWKKKDYNTIYTMINEFQNNILKDVRYQTTLSPKKVLSSNDAVVTATAHGSSVNIDHSLVVKQLATGAKMMKNGITPGSNPKSAPLFTQFRPTGTAGENPIAVGDVLEFKINGKEISITVDINTTMNDVAKAINGSGAGVQASYDPVIDTFILTTKETGADAKIDFTGTVAGSAGENFLKINLGLDMAGKAGQNAEIELDGVTVNPPSNEVTISGVTYTLKSVSASVDTGVPDSSNPGQNIINWTPTNISIRADNDKAYNTIMSFVDDYNALVDAINKQLTADRYRDFLPLSSEQKAAMKDSEIAAWEAKAKSGMLRNDSILGSMLSNMRLNFVNPVAGVFGKYNSASSIGITTSSYTDAAGNMSSAVQNGGKISINPDDLRKALEDNPDVLFDIFGSVGDGEGNASRGVLNRLFDQMDAVKDQLAAESGKYNSIDTSSNLAKRLQSFDERLVAINRQMQSMQARFYKQFDALEVAIGRMNQQSAWLTQQLGGGQ